MPFTPAARRLPNAMGFLHRNHDEPGTRYQMREKLFAHRRRLLDRERGRPAGLQGRRQGAAGAQHARHRDPVGRGAVQDPRAQAPRPRHDDIERDGEKVATVKKALISPLRERFNGRPRGRRRAEAKGNIVDHEYEIERDGHKVAEVSKRWFRVRDTYGIEIAPGEDDALVLAVTVCIDQMTHD